MFTAQGGVFTSWAGNSLIYAGGGALIGTLLSALAGYALAKFRFRGREFLFSVVLGGVLVPSVALALPLFLMFSAVHQVNTYWSVILPSVVNPFGVFLARVFTTAAVPDEILESARLDGAGEFRIFSQVSLRLLAPSLVTIFLFQFIGIWNNFFLPMVMLQSQSLYPITLGLFNWNASVNQYPDLQQSIITGSFDQWSLSSFCSSYCNDSGRPGLPPARSSESAIFCCQPIAKQKPFMTPFDYVTVVADTTT